MASIRDQILDAVVLALNTDAPIGIPVAIRRRVTQLAELPAIDVAPVKEQVERIGGRWGPLKQRSFYFKVRCWARDDAPEKAADAMVVWATKALSGNYLGGLVQSLEESSSEWQDEAAETIYGVAEVEFLAAYQTKTADQELLR
jgi:hypothetical protein